MAKLPSKRAAYLVFLLSFPLTGAFAALRGDWQSAGAPARPYHPGYAYRYECQAELTDQIDRVGDGKAVPEGKPYRLYAVQKFHLDRNRPYTPFDGNWEWVARLSASDRKSMYLDLKQEPEEAFSTFGHSAGLSFAEGGAAGEDQITLSAFVALSHAGYFLTNSERNTVSRKSPSVQVRASAWLYRETDQSEKLPRTKVRELFVVCDKIK